MNSQTTPPINSSFRLLVWHPDIHRCYGEDLVFFLIAAATYDNWFKLEVEQQIRRMDVQGWCMYELYGFYDLLVRAWMSPDQRQGFLDAMRGKHVLDIAEFLVSDVDYLWSPEFQQNPHMTREVLQKYPAKRLAQLQVKEPDEAEVSSLKREAVILKSARISTDMAFDGIKFYMCLNYPVPANQHEVKNEIKSYLRNMDRPFKDVSIYTGFGFARFLIKGIAPYQRVYDISEFALSLMSRFRLIRMKSTTSLIASPRVFESDNVHFGRSVETIAGEVQRDIVEELSVAHKAIASLGKFERRLVEDKYEQLRNSGALSAHKGILVPLFQAFIERDPDKVKRNLILFLEFERDFRTFSCRLMAETFGDQWAKTDFPRLRDSAEVMQDKIDLLTLHDWISILGKIDAEQKTVSGILGPTWEKIIRTGTNLRNQFAHARLDDPLGMWDSIVDFLAEFLPIYDLIKAKATSPKHKENANA